MQSEISLTKEDIKSALRAVNRDTGTESKVADFKVKKIGDDPTKFGKLALCEGEIWNVTG